MEYDALFGNGKTRVLPYKIDDDSRHVPARPAGHYSSVRFLLSGKPTDGNEGSHRRSGGVSRIHESAL